MGTPGINYSVAFSLVMNGITELMHRPNLYNWKYAEHPTCIRRVKLFQTLKDGRPNPALIFTASQLCEACGYDRQSYNGGSMQYSQRHRQNVNEWLLRLSKERCFIYYKKLNPITKNQETEVSYGKAAPISVRYLRDGKVSWKRPPGRGVRYVVNLASVWWDDEETYYVRKPQGVMRLLPSGRFQLGAAEFCMAQASIRLRKKKKQFQPELIVYADSYATRLRMENMMGRHEEGRIVKIMFDSYKALADIEMLAEPPKYEEVGTRGRRHKFTLQLNEDYHDVIKEKLEKQWTRF